MEIIGRGAEAIIYKDGNSVIKERISKGYRLPILDKQIIKRRTKAETKILKKASEITNVPQPQETKEINKIKMPYIKGEKLSDFLDSYNQELQEKIMFQIGKSISKLHKEGIIHGDLTTSNMIYISKSKTPIIYLIDFGLGYLNGKYENKGVDIHLLKQALEAKHFTNWKTLFQEFEIGYRSIEPQEAQKVFEKLSTIEKRGRYKH